MASVEFRERGLGPPLPPSRRQRHWCASGFSPRAIPGLRKRQPTVNIILKTFEVTHLIEVVVKQDDPLGVVCSNAEILDSAVEKLCESAECAPHKKSQNTGVTGSRAPLLAT